VLKDEPFGLRKGTPLLKHECSGSLYGTFGPRHGTPGSLYGTLGLRHGTSGLKDNWLLPNIRACSFLPPIPQNH